jgi:positive regulator of sigma E activity
MKIFTKIFAGQSLISWVLQLIMIYLAWGVADHRIQNNLTTIFGAAILILLTYLSLAMDSRHRNEDK